MQVVVGRWGPKQYDGPERPPARQAYQQSKNNAAMLTLAMALNLSWSLISPLMVSLQAAQ